MQLLTQQGDLISATRERIFCSRLEIDRRILEQMIWCQMRDKNMQSLAVHVQSRV
jgi:hypothetical protein